MNHLPHASGATGRRVGIRLDGVPGVPDGLAAHRVEHHVARVDGTVTARRARSGRVRADELVLVAAAPLEGTCVPGGHATVRRALARTSRRWRPDRDELGATLARAGLVVLHAVGQVGRDATLTAGRWTRWERTVRGDVIARCYARPEDGTPAEVHAVAEAYADTHAPADACAWREARDGDLDRIAGAVRRAVELARGRAAGWPLSRYAREVTGDTHGLDADARLAPIVVAAISHRFGIDPPARDRALEAAGVINDRLAVAVVALGLPGADGPAGALLRTACDAAAPVSLLLTHLPPVDGAGAANPVAPPPPGHPGWVFAVENEALIGWAAAHRPTTPVVWHGTRAATRLLVHAARAGWRVAVSADFEWGGVARASSLLAAVPGAIPWRLDAAAYTAETGSGDALTGRRVETPWDPSVAAAMARRRVRVTEEEPDRFDRLCDDLLAGRPGDA